MAVRRSTKVKRAPKPESPEEPTSTNHGHKLQTMESVTAMGHILDGAIQRANVSRLSLDTTINWAIVSTGATLSIAFSQPEIHHGIIIVNGFLVLWFLLIDARRYRAYELWSHRIRLMETNFYAAMFIPPFHPSPEWTESFIENLLIPRFPISMWQALGRRLRRYYFWIFLVLYASWGAKIWLFPQPAATLEEFIRRGATGPVSGEIVIALGLAFYFALALVAIGTIPRTPGKGEARRYRNSPYRRALIITGKAEAVSHRLLSDMKLNVTPFDPIGMYTDSDRTVLACTLSMTEARDLKTAVAKADPQAFVIVSPAQGFLGRGFNPAEDE